MDSRERIRGFKDGRDGLTSARQVLRRLTVLSEGRQYREAANLVCRLGPSVLRSVVSEIPLDLLVDSLPHSAYLLESFFNRLNATVATPKPKIQAEAVIWHLVKLFGSPHESGMRQRCTNLIHAIGIWQPEILDLLKDRRKALDQAVQGLGLHGLITDHNRNFLSLNAALKNELQFHIETYKMALHKLEELNAVTMIQKDPAQSSHQRLLAYNYADIQQRLIDNKTLLTKIDKPALKQLGLLIQNLLNRVQNDKEVLLCVGEIKRNDVAANFEERPAAGLLMNFSRGCSSVLNIMESIPKMSPISLSGGSGSDGYHSDPDHSDDQKSELVKQYNILYEKTRVETLEALNSLQELKKAQILKSKILFSIIVLAFRSCYGLKERKILEVRRILYSLEKHDTSTDGLDDSVRLYLKMSADNFPISEIERQVANQVLSTLHEYPCLSISFVPLKNYITDCVRLAWKMSNETCPYYLDMDFTMGKIRLEKQERYQTSDMRSDLIRSFVWPALIQNGLHVQKAIVMT
ncbi:unnamed protein product [Diamesa hyperborea]